MLCSYFPGNVDGQARRCNIGADEIRPVTLALGLPTQPLRAVGVCGVAPHSPAALIVSPTIAASPLATPFGSLEVVAKGAVLIPFPPADTNGVSLVKVRLASLPTGTNIALQALATTLLVR